MAKSYIYEVGIKKLEYHVDGRGFLFEILRCDDKIFKGFGQVYCTTVKGGCVKAWHMHKEQWDSLVCLHGLVRLVLYDDRDKSPTKGEVNEFFLGSLNPLLIQIPPRVWHGMQGLAGENEYSYILNIPNKPYDKEKPDEYRLPPNTDKIPYSWKLKPWLDHG